LQYLARGIGSIACGRAEAGGECRRHYLRSEVGRCSLPVVKASLIAGLLLAFSATAFADAPKNAPLPKKLPKEERVYVMDKDAPSADKTVPLFQTRVVSKNK